MSESQRELPSKYRRPPQPWLSVALVFGGIAMVMGVIYIFHLRPFGFALMDLQYLYLIFALFLPLCFLWIPASKGAPRDRIPWYDVLLCVISFAIPVYACSNAVILYEQGWSFAAPPEGFALALILWPVLIEAARRAGGNFFAAVVLLFSVYPLVAGFAPGAFKAVNFPLTRVANYHIYGEDSFLGIPAHAFGRLFFGYMVFAIAIQSVGVGKFFNQVAVSVVGGVRGGNAKVAIISSGFFGSISGAPVANVFTTGAFTIPAMKKDGFPSEFAGAVEATASTGGALMPPVMGVTAFIMAEFLAIPYVTVALAAVVPSLLYYFSMFMQIDAYAAKNRLQKSAALIEEVPPLWRILLNNVHIIICFLILIYLLVGQRLEAWAPWIATAVLFIVIMFKKETRLGPRGFVQFLEDLGRVLGDLIGVIGPIGLIIGAFILSGIAFALPYTIVELAGGNIYLMLIFGAIASFILGMGVTISAVYIFLAIALCPGLVMAGLNQLAVHLFVLYCALMSYITPPVALSAFAAAIVAGSNPIRTGFRAMRLGIVIFIVPFFFVMNPALILQGAPLEILQTIVTCFLGLVLIAGSLEAYLWRVGIINIPIRVLLFVAGVLIAYPDTITDIWGLALAGVVLGIAIIMKRWGWGVVSLEAGEKRVQEKEGEKYE